jgi:hypothetical protein
MLSLENASEITKRLHRLSPAGVLQLAYKAILSYDLILVNTDSLTEI